MPDPSRGRPALRQALLRTTDALADLDVARWRPEVADELMALRTGRRLSALPRRRWRPRAVRSRRWRRRCRAIVELALEDDGGAVTAAEAEARRHALAPLDRAAQTRDWSAACPVPWAAA